MPLLITVCHHNLAYRAHLKLCNNTMIMTATKSITTKLKSVLYGVDNLSVLDVRTYFEGTKHCVTESRYARIKFFSEGAKQFNESILPLLQLQNGEEHCKKVTENMFRRFCPWYLKKRTYHTCVCVHHETFRYHTKAIHEYARVCQCEICKEVFFGDKNYNDFHTKFKSQLICSRNKK